MATLLRLLWSIAVTFVIVHFIPSPWCWIWVGIIWGTWGLILLLSVYQLGIRNGWPLRRS